MNLQKNSQRLKLRDFGGRKTNTILYDSCVMVKKYFVKKCFVKKFLVKNVLLKNVLLKIFFPLCKKLNRFGWYLVFFDLKLRIFQKNF